MGSAALPLGQQILFLLFSPPIGALLWLFMARGWARQVQGGTISDQTKQRQKKLFWGFLIFMYIFNLGTFIYAHFIMSDAG